MRQVICKICGEKCIKYGKTAAGSQRWFCKKCSVSFIEEIDNSAKQLEIFLKWLFGKESQKDMKGEGRTFRRNTSKFWDIWPMAPKIDDKRDVVYVDGIYLARKACVLICCDEYNVLGWYVCKYENARAWRNLLNRIAQPEVVVSDGGQGFKKALKKTWPNAKHQRCVFHVFFQIKRYTTSNPRTLAGMEMYNLGKDLLKINTKEEAKKWTGRFKEWSLKHKELLSQRTYYENGSSRPTHERLLKAERSVYRLLKENTLFTYLDEDLTEAFTVPATNNRIEGGINSRLREMLRLHRGLSVERRLKAVFWWCYMHSPNPLSESEILKVMPTEQSIAALYSKMTYREKLEDAINSWGDAISWEEFHGSGGLTSNWD